MPRCNPAQSAFGAPIADVIKFWLFVAPQILPVITRQKVIRCALLQKVICMVLCSLCSFDRYDLNISHNNTRLYGAFLRHFPSGDWRVESHLEI
jgi:hypothetical protein